ncbi:MAG: hypothetical protein WAT72_02995 [Microgenomates group bacterium]|nr:DUF11 domain-containing protein [Candidatus Woesebacteria bacterium]
MIKGTRVVTFLLSGFLFLSLGQGALAQYGQYGAYGPYGQGGQSNSILVDKTVGMNQVTTKGGTTSTTFVDNLGSTDQRFFAGQTVSFKIKVKNTSDHKLSNIVVKDTLPTSLEAVDVKNYDSATRTITLSDNLALNAGEEYIYTLNTKVVSQEKLPTDKGVFCVYNKAVASNSMVSDDDAAQFCIEKKVLGVKSQPNAGPEYGLGLLALQMLGLGSGTYLKRRVK